MSDSGKSKTTVSESLLAILLALASVPLNGWVLSILWLWFVVPLGVPAIGIAQAVGLATLIGMLRRGSLKSDDAEPLITAATLLVSPFLYLGCGALAHHFMVSP